MFPTFLHTSCPLPAKVVFGGFDGCTCWLRQLGILRYDQPRSLGLDSCIGMFSRMAASKHMLSYLQPTAHTKRLPNGIHFSLQTSLASQLCTAFHISISPGLVCNAEHLAGAWPPCVSRTAGNCQPVLATCHSSCVSKRKHSSRRCLWLSACEAVMLTLESRRNPSTIANRPGRSAGLPGPGDFAGTKAQKWEMASIAPSAMQSSSLTPDHCLATQSRQLA